jgi:peptide-methionine (R)-S-oxide reductase
MMNRRKLLAGVASIAVGAVFEGGSGPSPAQAATLQRSETEWRRRLSAAQFNVLRQAGTEQPFSSALDHETRPGRFNCAGCGTGLFSSRTKFDSGTGWPSFWQPLPGVVVERPDRSGGMSRTEVLCRRCGGHLGHLFKDGPQPTGLRYCMNGTAMTFRPGTT